MFLYQFLLSFVLDLDAKLGKNPEFSAISNNYLLFLFFLFFMIRKECAFRFLIVLFPIMHQMIDNSMKNNKLILLPIVLVFVGKQYDKNTYP